MSRGVPEEVETLITGEPVVAHFATSVDDRPHVAPVWYDYADGTLDVLISGKKLANVRRNPRVAVSIQKDVEGRTRWMVTMLGTATVVDETDAVREATRRINRKYGAAEDSWSENHLVHVDVGSATYRIY